MLMSMEVERENGGMKAFVMRNMPSGGLNPSRRIPMYFTKATHRIRNETETSVLI